MANLPLEERMTPENEAKFRDKIQTQIGMAKDIASDFGGKPASYLKKFNQVNRQKIRALQVGVGKGLQKKLSNIRPLHRSTTNIPLLKKAA